jgi:hypothetical protein
LLKYISDIRITVGLVNAFSTDWPDFTSIALCSLPEQHDRRQQCRGQAFDDEQPLPAHQPAGPGKPQQMR